MINKNMAVGILTALMALCAAPASAASTVISDCGECAGHVLSGSDEISVVSGRHDIVLQNVLIDVSGQSDCAAFLICEGAEVNLTLENENILISGKNRAGLQVSRNARLTMTGESTGSLTAWGGLCGAGIGGALGQDCGEIRIDGGTIIAHTRSLDCAAIGGGKNAEYEMIMINGGTVYAYGKSTGIGGNETQNGGIVEINGGTVYALSTSETKVAIGNVCPAPNSRIAIRGGTVYAKSPGNDEGYTIGCVGGTIELSGGRVYLMGGKSIGAESSILRVEEGVLSDHFSQTEQGANE